MRISFQNNSKRTRASKRRHRGTQKARLRSFHPTFMLLEPRLALDGDATRWARR